MKRYPNTLTDADVLVLLKTSAYKVDLETAAITGPTGKSITPWPDKRGRWFVRLYAEGCKRRAVMRAKLVWMAGANSTVPKDFEVHHQDEDNTNDRWDNLLCVHKADHGKFHGRDTRE